MIRLVASDIDGTLLPHGQSRIKDSFFEVIDALEKLGVYFAAASGRQLPSQKMLFEKALDKIIFIAENGALVEYKGETISEKTMRPALVREIIADIQRTPGCEPIISTKETVYISQFAYNFFRSREKEILYTTTITDDFFSKTDNVLKITACKYDGIGDTAASFHRSWKRFASVTVSGFMYCDFMEKSVSKGNALGMVMDRLGVRPEECIAFGDNYNDISMLDRAEFTFAMKHADDEVRAHAMYETDDVEGTVRKIFNL